MLPVFLVAVKLIDPSKGTRPANHIDSWWQEINLPSRFVIFRRGCERILPCPRGFARNRYLGLQGCASSGDRAIIISGILRLELERLFVSGSFEERVVVYF